jgi:hypothetical protein
MDDLANFEMIIRLIHFAYEGTAWASMQLMALLIFLYGLTPDTWPDPYRFGAIGAVAGVAWATVIVLRR